MRKKISGALLKVGMTIITVCASLGLSVAVVGISLALAGLLAGLIVLAVLAVPGVICIALSHVINPESALSRAVQAAVQDARTGIT